ncbi:MAG: hypothetical protein GYB66_02090 [Chloroflexi bacterium]|nr:hypothetical protein [Chloroflexota bacterium]
MHVPQHWRLKSQRYQLLAERHDDGSVSFPPRPNVPRRTLESYDLMNVPDRTRPTERETERLVHVA